MTFSNRSEICHILADSSEYTFSQNDPISLELLLICYTVSDPTPDDEFCVMMKSNYHRCISRYISNMDKFYWKTWRMPTEYLLGNPTHPTFSMKVNALVHGYIRQSQLSEDPPPYIISIIECWFTKIVC